MSVRRYHHEGGYRRTRYGDTGHTLVSKVCSTPSTRSVFDEVDSAGREVFASQLLSMSSPWVSRNSEKVPFFDMAFEPRNLGSCPTLEHAVANEEQRSPGEDGWSLQANGIAPGCKAVAYGGTGSFLCIVSRFMSSRTKCLSQEGRLHCLSRLGKSLLVGHFTMRTGRSDAPRTLVSNLIRLSTMPGRRGHVT